MYAGISGMKNFQTKLDVIGNNIANVNTAGFKKGRITFQDMLSQTSQGASGPTANRGGINPQQVGTGSKIGSIDTIHTEGFQQYTGGPYDVMIQGDGMFAVQMSADNNDRAYTRSGNFGLSDDGNGMNNLITTSGYKLLNADGQPIAIPKEAEKITIEGNGKITYLIDGQPVDNPDAIIGLAIIPNPGGLEKIGGNLYRNTNNSGYDQQQDGLSAPENKEVGAGSLVSGVLEMSNVDLSEEFTEMITAQRAFQANTRIITTSDEILQELVNLKR